MMCKNSWKMKKCQSFENKIFHEFSRYDYMIWFGGKYILWKCFQEDIILTELILSKSPIILSTSSEKGVFEGFFHLWFFVAFNSRDMTMLWVLNLFSRSSPTKLWKRIFDLRSQNIFFDIQSWHVGNFSRNGSVGNVKFETEISMKTFVSKKFFMFFNLMPTCFATPKDCEKVP